MTTRTADTRYPLATALFLASTTHYLCLMAFGYVGPLSTLQQVCAGVLAGLHCIGVLVMLVTWCVQWQMRRMLSKRVVLTDYRWPIESGDVRPGGRGGHGERVN